ncbi:MAG: hypothetical protein GW858_13555 [Sphingomonadales bacterium]|nr:hypothetical protein [Sphingomonadales bacterium]NCQ22272.1 hypothetical protein [Sphingomonadales bacterium]NCT04697.1 hypothetical protein [Sphingomonadales bacterium]
MEWPVPLVRDLARRRAIVVVGSGVSRQSTNADGNRPPTWKSFLQSALDVCPGGGSEAINAALQANDLLHACEWLKDKYDEHWTDYLRRTFSDPGYEPSETHRAILALDSRVVFSLNFDTIYERCAQNIKSGAHIIRQYHDKGSSEFLRGDGRYIVKVHGSIDAPEKLIFTQKDYAEAQVKYSAFYKSFDAGLLSNTFLFVGTGYSDPDVNLILENQAFSFPTNYPHYIIRAQGDSQELKSSLRKNRNLKTIEYDPIDDNHSGLLPVLADLAAKVEEARSDLTFNYNW